MQNEIQDIQILLAKERTALAVERNHFANERTFLAWLRTGLASVGGGIALIRFLNFETIPHQVTSKILGSILILLGISIFFLSFLGYKRSYNKFKMKYQNGFSLWAIGTIVFILILVSFILLYISIENIL